MQPRGHERGGAARVTLGRNSAIHASDHCTAVPEYDHAAGCMRHDRQGGSRCARRKADRAFYKCLGSTTKWRLARRRYLGVRLGQSVSFSPGGGGIRVAVAAVYPSGAGRLLGSTPRSGGEVYEAILDKTAEADKISQKAAMAGAETRGSGATRRGSAGRTEA